MLQLATKIKYEQRFLDDELRSHIHELLEKLSAVPTDDEAEDEGDGEAAANGESNKENKTNGNQDDDDDEFETTSDEDEPNSNNKNSKVTNGKSKTTKQDVNNNQEEPMELT